MTESRPLLNFKTLTLTKEAGRYEREIDSSGDGDGVFLAVTAGLAAKVLFKDKFTTLDPS